MNEFLGPALTATGILGLFTAAATLIIQLFRQNATLAAERDRQIRDLKDDIQGLKVENAKQKVENFACRMQVNGLCDVLQKGGLSIPDWLFRDGRGEG